MWIGSPPPAADAHVPRAALERQALDVLVPGGTVALVADGPGPCGLTQLALTIAAAADTDLTIWVNATSRVSVLATYAEAAAAVGRAPDQFPSWLRDTDRSWLLILDSLTTFSHLPDDVLPSGPSGRVLITGMGVPQARMVRVPGFDRRESMTYLMGLLTADVDQRQGAADLIAELGDEPAAITLAASVIASSDLNCHDYREHFLHESGAPPTAPFHSTAVAWGLALEHADAMAPGEAQRLLAMTALLDADGIPVEVLGGGLEAVRLAGLVTVSGGLVRVASPVRAMIRAATPEGMLKSAADEAADALLAAWPSDVSSGIRCAESLRVTAGDLLWQGGCHPVLIRAGRALDDLGLSTAAADWWGELAATATRVLDPTHPDTLTIVERRTAAQLAAGRFAEAIAAYSEQINRAYNDHGADSQQVLNARERLAGAHLADGRPKDAIALYRGILSDRERSLGPAHPDTVRTCCLFARAQLADDRPKDAISLLKRALNGQERLLGAKHPDTIAIRAELAATYHAAGRMAAAVQLYEQTRDGYADLLGADHRETLNASLRLAHAYFGVGRLGDVTRVLRETLSRCEATLGPSDPLTVAVRESLANVSG
jgi:tetratricopeptide (TPR) repeat protein